MLKKMMLLMVLMMPTLSLAEPINSGEIVKGLRVLDMDKGMEFSVFRGDYVKFKNLKEDLKLSISDLGLEKELKKDWEASPLIKMKQVGTFTFTLGKEKGTLHIKEYQTPNYHLVSAKEANEIIQNVKPLVLDVRTNDEYSQGHLEGAKLIPVQELQNRLKELDEYKNQDILIYCHSGNRSTVASKLLMDLGFKRVYNLSTGITGWKKADLPVKK